MTTNRSTLASILSRIAFDAVGSSRLYNYSSNMINITDASVVILLIQPKIKQHQGYFLIDDLFDVDAFNKWIEFFPDDKSEVERNCNLIDVASLFRIEGIDRSLLKEVAIHIRQNWLWAIKDQIDRDFDVSISLDDIGDPSLTFFVRR